MFMQDIANQAKFENAVKASGVSVEEFCKEALKHVTQAGIPLVPTVAVHPQMAHAFANVAVGTAPRAAAAQAVAASGEQVTVTTKWWGVDIEMNEKMTQDVINGVTAAGSLAGPIATAFAAAGVVTGGLATLFGAAVAGICVAKVFEMKLVDNGKGVSWPISWPQWAVLVAAAPGGPAAVIAAGMVFIHPTRN